MRLTKRQSWTLVFAIVFPVTGYCWYAYAGPFKWLAELQIKIMGEYDQNLTVILTLLAVLLPILGISNLPPLRGWLDLSPMTPDELAEDKARKDRVFGKNSVIPWWPLAIGTICLVPGLYLSVQTWGLGNLATVDVTELHPGASPPSNWVDASGFAMGSRSIAIEEGRPKKKTNNYVPLVAEGWEPDDPVNVYVQLDGEKMLSDSPVTLRGRLVQSGLPGMIREAFARSAAPPADGHWLLENDFDPSFRGPMGKGLLIAAGICYAIAGVLYLLYRGANQRGGWTT